MARLLPNFSMLLGLRKPNMSAYSVRRISADLPLCGSVAMLSLLFVALLGFTIDREHVCSQRLEGERVRYS
jgi:hypothetical protein